MSEYIICGIAAFLGLAFFVTVNITKAKIGWSWINYNKKEDK